MEWSRNDVEEETGTEECGGRRGRCRCDVCIVCVGLGRAGAVLMVLWERERRHVSAPHHGERQSLWRLLIGPLNQSHRPSLLYSRPLRPNHRPSHITHRPSQ